jgi:Ser/Thr protein kinase RdoA (MazF antagonist)
LPFVTYKSGQKNEFADFRHFRAISRRFGRPLVGMDKEERLHTIGRILGRLETYPASGELVVWRYDPSRDRRARD